jgi:hypothetical protein
MSAADDARTAGLEAAGAAMAGLGQAADLVIISACMRYDLPAVVAAINEVTDGAPLVGSTSAGSLHDGSFIEPGTGVSVLTLAGGGYRDARR